VTELDGLGVRYSGGRVSRSFITAPHRFAAILKAIHLCGWVRQHVPASAEAVFIGGNGFRSIDAIATLEKDLGRPVLTANQALFWHALQIAAVDAPVAGYGMLFDHPLPTGG
jgi:maleate isomerase